MIMVLKISCSSFKNTVVKFAELKKLTLRSYTTVEALSTTSQIKLIDKREFTKIALDKNFKMFIVYTTPLKVPIVMLINFYRASKVKKSTNLTLAIL